MTRAALAAGLAGCFGVLACWDVLAELQASRVSSRLVRALAPLRGGAAGTGDDVTAAERRQLIALLAAVLAAAGLLVGGPVPAVIGAVAGPWLTGRALAARRARWRRALADGASVAARSIADALAGGHSVRGALAEAAEAGGAGPVVDRELLRARAALALGAPTDRVLEDLRRRAAGPVWDTLVAAILLQREAGGDLAALLRELAAELEAVRRVEADARAATAQARFTAGTVAVLPVLAAGLGELASPGTTARIAGNPIALALGIAAALLQIAGIVVVRRLARPPELRA